MIPSTVPSPSIWEVSTCPLYIHSYIFFLFFRQIIICKKIKGKIKIPKELINFWDYNNNFDNNL